MIALFLLLVVPWTCLAFEYAPNVKLSDVANDVILQSNYDDPKFVMYQRKVDKLEKDNELLEKNNKSLERRLKKLEESVRLGKESKKLFSHDTTSYHEEVVFLIENHSSFGHIPTGNITWDYGIVRVNQASSFSQHSGVFTAPVDGIYTFQFMCYTQQSGRADGKAEIKLYINGKDEEHFWNVELSDDIGSYAGHLSLFWTADLKANDELWLVNIYEQSVSLYSFHGMYFMGKILTES